MRHLPAVIIEPLVREALREDLGRAGDLTTDWTVPADRVATAELVARDPGTDLAVAAFRLLEPSLEVEVARPDGSAVAPGDVVARVSGPARGILTAERVALNFLGHLSGVATATPCSRKRATNRPAVCGVSAISGTSTIAWRPCANASAMAWR